MTVKNVEIFLRVVKFVGRFSKEMKRIVSPLDSWALRLHSPVSSGLLLLAFGLVVFGAFTDPDVKCYNPQDKLKVLEDVMTKEICTSYSSGEFHHRREQGEAERRNLLYRWIPSILVTLAIMAHIPQMVRSRLEIRMLTSTMDTLMESNEEGINTTSYIHENLGGHGGQVMSSFFVSFCCLLSDGVSVFLLDLALENKFINIPNPDLQTNYTQMFPLTTTCVLSPQRERMTGWNTLVYGCEFPMNFYYYKMFIILFGWFCFLTLSSSISLFLKIVQQFPWLRKRGIASHQVPRDCEATIYNHLSTSELWVLGKLRKFSSDELFLVYLTQAFDLLRQENQDEYADEEEEPVVVLPDLDPESEELTEIVVV